MTICPATSRGASWHLKVLTVASLDCGAAISVLGVMG